MRTENEVIKDFEKLGYRIEHKNTKYASSVNAILLLKDYIEAFDDEKLSKEICIDLNNKSYQCYETFYYCPLELTMEEHLLLTELFKALGWIKC